MLDLIRVIGNGRLKSRADVRAFVSNLPKALASKADLLFSTRCPARNQSRTMAGCINGPWLPVDGIRGLAHSVVVQVPDQHQYQYTADDWEE